MYGSRTLLRRMVIGGLSLATLVLVPQTTAYAATATQQSAQTSVSSTYSCDFVGSHFMCRFYYPETGCELQYYDTGGYGIICDVKN